MKRLLVYGLLLMGLLFVGCGGAEPADTAVPESTVVNEVPPAPVEAYPVEVEAGNGSGLEAYPGVGSEGGETAVPESYPSANQPPAKGTPVVQNGELISPTPQPIKGGEEMPAQEIPEAVLQLPITQNVIADLSAKLGIDAAQIKVVAFEEVTWRDSSLGCPQPGMAYLQVLSEGYRIVLQANGQNYDYHTNMSNQFVLCVPDGSN
ncbi:MAG: hypothetical protein Kow0080_36430 [Candidatus Promineifilaceae bacterium]